MRLLGRKVRLPGWLWIKIHRTQNRYYDLMAWARGYCNDAPWSRPNGGGYAHWRCALRRGHPGKHRSNNYVWTATERTEFAPLDIHDRSARPPYKWTGTPYARQQRVQDAFYARETAKRLSGDDRITQEQEHGA